jgi:hypothetical protein
MAGFNTYDAVGNRESVVDDIYDISPADNPVAAMSMTTTAINRLHQWQEDELADIRQSAAVEGADAGADTSEPTVMKSADCQIFEEVARITGTQEEVAHYGRASEMAYQLRKRYLQMARNEESAIAGDAGGAGRQTGTAGNATTARELTSIYSQADTSVIKYATDTQLVGGTAITTTEELEDVLLSAHLATFTAGGNPTYAITDPATGGYFPKFALSAGRTRDVMETSLINAVDLYVSQYGQVDVVLDRSMVQTSSAILLMDFEYSATPVLRATKDKPLATTGDAENRQVIRESTYALLNSKACAIVDAVPAGLTTGA